MTTIGREEFKNDPVFSRVFEDIKQHHVVPEHTSGELYKNRHVKDFCVEARHFVEWASFYIHYDVLSWYHSKGRALIRIDAITFYDNFFEPAQGPIRFA